MSTAGKQGAADRLGLSSYRDSRVAAMLFLGFAAGLPFPLVFATMSAWLSDVGVDRSQIGLIGGVAVFYSTKFLWAPLIDRLDLPLLTAALGRRRAWMLVAQLGVAICLWLLSTTEPSESLTVFAWACVGVAFFSATQDIVIDAYRIEAVEERLQGAMVATYQYGYRGAVLISVAGALYLADAASWQMAYRVMAGLMLVGMVTVALIAEPPAEVVPSRSSTATGMSRIGLWFAEAVIGPFAEFFRRNGWWALVLLLFAASFRLTDYVMGIMANPFYLELGYTKSEIASVAKVFGVVMTLIGVGAGGLAVGRFGAVAPLLPAAIALAVTNLLFALMALHGQPDLWMLAITITGDNLALGFSGTVLIAYLSKLTNVAYTATQYALFSSLMALPGKFIAMSSGFAVNAMGWVAFFSYAAAMGIPAIILAYLINRRERIPNPP